MEDRDRLKLRLDLVPGGWALIDSESDYVCKTCTQRGVDVMCYFCFGYYSAHSSYYSLCPALFSTNQCASCAEELHGAP